MATPNKLAYLNYEGLEIFWTKAKQYISDNILIDDVKIEGTSLVIKDKGINFGLDYRNVNNVPSICLIDRNAPDGYQVVDSFPATEFIKDGFLQKVEYDSSTKVITFTWNADAKITTTPVDLSGLVDTYKASNGIKIVQNVIQHTNAVTARTSTITAQSTTFGGTFNVVDVKYDAQGHITGHSIIKHTLPNSTASSTTKGLVQLGYAQNDKNYPLAVQDAKAYVNVPWKDTVCTSAIINEGTATSPNTSTVAVISTIDDLAGDGTKLQGTATRVNVVTSKGLDTAIQGVQGTLANHKSFSSVSVQGISLQASSINDTLTITSGSNVTLTPNTNNSFSISALNTKCTSLNFTPVTLSTSGDTVGVVANIPNATGTGTGFTASLQTVRVPTVQGVENAIKAHHTFKTVSAQGTSIQADRSDDVLTIVSGSNVTITGDATNDKIVISATNTNTSHGHAAGTGIELTGAAGTSGGTQTITAKKASSSARGAGRIGTEVTTRFDDHVSMASQLTNLAHYHVDIDIDSTDLICAKIPTITEEDIEAIFNQQTA